MPPHNVCFARFDHGRRVFALFQLHLVKPFGAQHFHRFGAIFMLRTFLLARHDDARGNVRKTHRAVGFFVDMLAARAGADIIDFKVLVQNFDLNRVIDHRRNGAA